MHKKIIFCLFIIVIVFIQCNSPVTIPDKGRETYDYVLFERGGLNKTVFKAFNGTSPQSIKVTITVCNNKDTSDSFSIPINDSLNNELYETIQNICQGNISLDGEYILDTTVADWTRISAVSEGYYKSEITDFGLRAKILQLAENVAEHQQ